MSSRQLVISDHPLTGLVRIFEDKIRLPETLTEELLKFVTQTGLIAEFPKGALSAIKDKNDIPVIYSALNGNTDLLVTGDRELLNLKIVDYYDDDCLDSGAFKIPTEHLSGWQQATNNLKRCGSG